MRKLKRFSSILALMLTLSMVLSACQVPEGVEVPSGVSIPSDLSDLTSEELEQLESYLEDAEASVDAEDATDSEDAVSGDTQEGDGTGAAGAEGATDADSTVSAEGTAGTDSTAAEDAQTQVAVKGTVDLPSGRDWVHKILNVEEYVKAYPDLQAAYGENWDGYVDHYLTYGLYEGRDEGKLFDPWEYAEAYPDVKAAYGDDANAIIQHYVNHGINEGKTAGTAAGYVDMADKTSREYMMSHDVVVRGPSSRLDALISHADNALKYARNVEGAKYPTLFVDAYNRDTHEPATWNRGSSDPAFVSNIYTQFGFLKVLDGLTLLTGDQKYSDAALEQIRFRYDNPETRDEHGLFYAGGHAFLDILKGRKYGLSYHETKDYQLPLELLWKADPDGAIAFMTGFWQSHIQDWSSIIFNRHGEWGKPANDAWYTEYTNPDPWIQADTAPFLSTGNDMMEMAWFLTKMTGDPIYAVWGDRMLEKYMGVAHPETLLVGEQYGNPIDMNYGGDRLLYSVLGADFVTNSGFDFKTATMDDYKVAGANCLINRTGTKCNTAYGPQVYAQAYRDLGNERLYDFCVRNLVGWAKYIYDPELHRYKTPILNDGTDLNEGKDGKKLIATRTGYYITVGKSFPEYESVWGGVYPGAIDALSIVKPEDEESYQIIWEAVRAFARNIGHGDIGTRMGENVNLNMNSTAAAPEYVQALLKMYKYTGHEDYLTLACKLADRIVASMYDPEYGVFDYYPNSAYVALDSAQMYVVFCAEAASQGYINEINLDLCHGNHDIPHQGMGQVGPDKVYYTSTKKLKEIVFDRDEYTITVDQDPALNYADLTTAVNASAIKQMAAISVMGAEADGLFHPEKGVTRGEMKAMVSTLFGFNDEAVIADVFADVDVATNPNYEVTRAELASILTRALKVKVPDGLWNSGNATWRLTDQASIPAWAKEYADVMTNYRIMVNIEEEVFNPSAVVTKDMAAGIFAEVGRFIELPGVKAIIPALKPFNATNDELFWETIDGSIVEVDSEGRLYPVSEGSTKVRVSNADGTFADLAVNVVVRDDWMIQEIRVNGEVLNSFNSDTLEHEINLDLGTHTVPTIEATSFTGDPVVIELPDSLPGAATLYVQGCDVKYTLQINNDYVDWLIDENFNHKIGTSIEKITTDKFQWFINGLTTRYLADWKVIPKNWVRPDYEGYGCMVFPYRVEYNVEGQCYLTFTDDYVQLCGEEADDKLMVFEMDIAVKNMKGKDNGYGIRIMERFGNTYHAAARFVIKEDGIAREVNSSSVDKPTKRALVDGEFVNLKLVLDKKNRTFHYYFNGELLQRDIPFFHGANVPNIYALYIATVNEEANKECHAELFLDNLKCYQITHDAFEELMPQEPIAPPTPKPEWLTNPININYDNYSAGKTIQQTSVDPYTGHIGEGLYYGYATVVNKNVVDATAEATDMALEMKYNPNATTSGSFRYIMDANVLQKLGTEADDKNLVIEMDLAVDGADAKPQGYRISISQALSGGYMSVARFILNDTEFGRIMNSSDKMVDPTLRTTVNKGDFMHLKVVINKKTKSFSYYVNDVMIEKNVPSLYSGIPDVGCILYTVYKEAEGELDSKLYMDNLNVYVEDPQPEGTPRPTHVPVPTPTPMPTATPHPYPINEDYNSYAEGTLFHSKTSTEYYTAAVSESNYTARGKVVAKTVVDSNAAAEDMCMELSYDTAYTLNYRIHLGDPYAYVLGTNAFGSRYIVAEMDIALKGTDAKAAGVNVALSQKLSGGYLSVAKFKLTDDTFARYKDSNNTVTGVAATKGQFGNLKVVIDKQTKKYTYFWNGQVVESEVNALFSGTPNLGVVHFQVVKEAQAGLDIKMYVDNLKLYESDVMPDAPTMAPATPAPTVDPNAPTAEPTPAPTPAPTINPVVVNATFDGYELGKMMHTISEDYWVGKLAESYGHEKGIVVAKKTVDPNADANDYCLEFTPRTSLETSRFHTLNFRMNIAEEHQVSLGSAVDENKYLVVEMDLAIKGQDAKPAGYLIRFAGDGTYALTNFLLKDDHLARYLSSSVTNTANEKNAYTKGEFVHLKWVLDRETKVYSYYMDDTLVEENVNAQFRGADQTPALKYICFQIIRETLAEGATGLDSKLYVDNVKVFVTDDNAQATPAPGEPAATATPTQAPAATPAPTAEPTATPAPTQNPVVVNATFDGYELGKMMHTISEDYWVGKLAESYGHEKGIVVAKNTVDSNADANDYCLEFTPRTSLETSRFHTLNFRMNIAEEHQVSLGSAVDTNKFLAVEMDLAIKGQDTKPAGYVIRLAGDGSFALTNFILKDDHLGRYLSSAVTNTANEKNAYTKGEFVHLKWIIDRETKKYSYFMDGNLVEADVNAQFDGADQTPALKYICFQIVRETLAEGATGLDSKLYVDNVEVYVTDEHPLATPSPTAEPTAAPTAAPTETPAAPTAAPTQDPGTPVTYDIHEIYDEHDVDTLLANTNTAKYNWMVYPAGYDQQVKIVNKSDIDPSAASGDKCIKFPYVHGYSMNGGGRMIFTDVYGIGSEPGTVVAEFDYAIGGADKKTVPYGVFMNTEYVENRTFHISRWQTDGEIYYLQKHENWDYHVIEETKGNVVKGQFNTVKIVIDLSTGGYDYYYNGQLMQGGMPICHTETSDFGTFWVSVPMDPTAIDSAIYIDNIKIYRQ